MLWLLLIVAGIILFVARANPSNNKGGSNSGGFADPATKSRVAHDLEQLAARPELIAYQLSLRSAVQYLRLGIITNHSLAPTATPEAGPVIQQVSASVAGQVTPPSAQSAAGSIMSQPLTSEAAFKALENINTLLYLGAFIFVVSASLFVGLAGTSGAFKTAFVVLLSLAFYGLGLWLFTCTIRLKPAGTTFVAIGQVLAPLAGLAAYQVMFEATHGPAIWLITSAISLAMYVLALRVVRQTYITYFMAFTVLSLFESGVAVLGAPVEYYAWGMSLVSIVFLFVARKVLGSKEFSEPFAVSAQIFMPVALLIAIGQIPQNGLLATGVTLLIAACYYYLAQMLTEVPSESELYIALAAILLPLGAGFVLTSQQSSLLAIALVAVVIGAFETLGAGLIAGQGQRGKTDIIATIGGLCVLLAAVVVLQQPTALLALLAVAAITNFASHYLYRAWSNLLLTILAVLSLPAVGVLRVWEPAQSSLILAFAYLVLGVILLVYRSSLKSWSAEHNTVAIFGYCVALTASLGSGLMLGHDWAALIAILVMMATVLASEVERQAQVISLSVGLLYLSVYQLLLLFATEPSAYGWVFLALALAMYGAGRASGLATGRWQIIRYGGLVAAYLAALTGLSLDLGLQLSAICGLFVAGLLSWYEARATAAGEAYIYGSGAVLMLAVDWLLYYAGIHETQVYTHLWAAYFAFLAYRYQQKGKQAESDQLIIIALGSVTIPLALQALGDVGSAYGLLLIIEGVLLVLAGIASRKRTVQYWGIATAVLSILYQLRGLWYVTLGAIGLGIIGLAVALLLRREQPKL